MKPDRLLVAVINHGMPEQAILLKQRFARHGHAVAIDSGSTLTPAQRKAFDLALPNVYYQGCIEAAIGLAARGGFSHVWIWASDVDTDDVPGALARCRGALATGMVGVYSPSSSGSFHGQMHPASGLGLEPVTFTDGFCVAARLDLLRQACGDFSGCRLGFGLDIHLGYLALRSGLQACVDHRHEVSHPPGAGYSVNDATREWQGWRSRQGGSARLFHRLARKKAFKTRPGMRLLLAFPWRSWSGAPVAAPQVSLALR